MVNDGARVAKHDHDFDGAEPVSLDEAPENRGSSLDGSLDEACRESLLVQFLSQSEGFAVAARSLGGSFASHSSLKGVKRN